MSQHTITLNTERGKQLAMARTKRKDLAKMSDDDIVKALFFENLEEVLKS